MKVKAYKDRYNIDGKDYTRVTSVLDYLQPKSLVDWKLKVGKAEADKISKEAMSIGTEVDLLVQLILKGKEKIMPQPKIEVRNCIIGFQRWLKDEKPKVIDWQVTCFSDELGLAGTRDILLEDCLIDVKCSGKINLNYWLQVAMYVKLSKLPIGRIGILRLDKFSSDYQFVVKAYDDVLVETYLGLLKYYHYIKAVEKGVEDEVTDREE